MTTRAISRIARCLRCAIAVLAALTMVSASAQEQWYQWDRDFDEDKKPWKEIEANIPAYPRPDDLVPFEAGAASPHRFFIDARSLSIGGDGVVRFEGMRCDMRQQKYYAVGNAGGGWARARNSQWRRIVYQERNNHHGVLYEDFLCPEKNPVGSVKEALKRLRDGVPYQWWRSP
jgi:CNP1-like family